MFRIFSIIGIVGIILSMLVIRLTSARRRRERRSHSRFRALEKLVAGWTMLCVLVLAASGLGPDLLADQHMAGYALLWHVIFGGGFIVGLTALAILWSEACRFGAAIQVDAGTAAPESASPPGRFDAGRKFLFWCFLVLGLTTALTILLSMLPLFGTHGMNLLFEAHRWSALLLLIAGIAFVLHK